jgi:ribosomal protein S18 acetylase RimI-like enzyme
VNLTGMQLQRLQLAGAPALAAFYNGLSIASKRTFRPIGETTTNEVCARIATENTGAAPIKYDLVALQAGEVIGWSFLWNLDKPDPVFGLAIADACHGLGLGTRLMTSVMDWAREQRLPRVELTVVTDNTVAQHLYEKQGFVRYDEFIGEDGLPYYRMRSSL